MQRTIAIFGAGPGLGAAAAHRFGREGYRVALVARRNEPLIELAKQLEQSCISAATFQADLSDIGQVERVVADIQAAFGRIDAAYYSPAGKESFLPASEMTTEMMQERMDLLFFGLVSVVNAVLPEMRKRGSGAILAGLGGSAVEGIPFMSGPAPAQAAARNYLFSLHGELSALGICVGMVTISAVIANSAYHQSVLAGEADAPGDFEMPLVDPANLADQLWKIASGQGEREALYPPAQG